MGSMHYRPPIGHRNLHRNNSLFLYCNIVTEKVKCIMANSCHAWHNYYVGLYENRYPAACPVMQNAAVGLQEIFYWNGQLVWTPALGHYLCVGDRGPGTVSSGIYRPPFCAVGTNVRRWLSYSHWQAYIHYAFIRQMASFLVIAHLFAP